ncbi:pilus motility taxis protein HmpF [Thermoleptolyngbya sp. M55_K2018_002]|uniref:pilus motility taxis protein HmpF n=1 Tax=Thermoleptolyngbya sp. M55_K2018_002 TaxID=2747808 RepID=UPI0019DC84E6|nr:pilus motility taxis protein HmpF [Thermoleptolyngbya sp. M55_K2018_002]HIK39835.1 hypothetical protein [Thermoleptolyngbya sp. M55_K2018_002]
MLYLAEVQRKSRVIGSSKAELRLLACQRSENSWSAVPGEEVIPAPDDVTYGAGVLVMVELSGTKQVQRHAEAGRQLVAILQNFSRAQERYKTQEEEIQQWKESLTYQSQELNRREMEMEARQEQLQEMEEDFERLEQQRQEIESKRQEVEALKAEFDRKNQELEGAWAQLRGEMGRLDEQKAQFTQAAVLDDAKAQELQELLNRLAGAIAPTEAAREQVTTSFDLLNQQQTTLDQHYQMLDEQRNAAQQAQDALDQQVQQVQALWQEWQQSKAGLDQARDELAALRRSLELKQEQVQSLNTQLQQQDSLHQQFCQLADVSDRFTVGAKVDVSGLESMPIEELENIVRDLTNDLEKMSRFVNSQEEELTAQQEEMQNLQQQIQQASEYDRLRLEAELTDEQDRYRMLEETLVGQRRNLQERQAVLKQHQTVLDKRQGRATADASEETVDIAPVLTQLETLRQELAAQLQQAEAQVQELQAAVEQAQQSVDQQSQAQEDRWNRAMELEQQVLAQKAAVGEQWGKVNAYQEALALAQGGAGGIREKLELIGQILNQFQETSDYQLQAIAELRQIISSLTEQRTPEFVIT